MATGGGPPPGPPPVISAIDEAVLRVMGDTPSFKGVFMDDGEGQTVIFTKDDLSEYGKYFSISLFI